MEVKGTAFLARRALLIQDIGEARFGRFMDHFCRQEPFFLGTILPTTNIPMGPFLRFNDALVKDLCMGDWNSLWRFGEESANWSFTHGTLAALLNSRDVEAFATSGAALYASYFNQGRAESSLKLPVVHLAILDVPKEFRHLYFEYAIAGYFKRGLELVGARSVVPQRLAGFASGDADARYTFTLVM